MTRVVVTGATGFIGRRLVERLVKHGYNGTGAQVVGTSRGPRPDWAPPAVEWHALDLASAEPAAIAAIVGRDAVVIHCAANASARAGQDGYRNNVESVERLIAGLKAATPQRVVYVSSIGAVDRVPSDDCRAPLSEQSVPNPLTVYGRSKRVGEQRIAASGLPYAIVRPTWVYGPHMRADSHIRYFLSMVRKGSAVTRINFPGRVSIIHVDDLCDALLVTAQHPKALGRAFFAADGEPISLGQMYRELGELTGRVAGRMNVPGFAAGIARALRRFLPFSVQLLNSDVLVGDETPLRDLGFVSRVPRRTGFIELARATAAPGKRWIVTGAARGIGRALATQLYCDGHALEATDRDDDGLASLQRECPDAAIFTGDLTTDAGRAALAARVGDGPLGGLVNCAGVGVRGDAATASMEAQEKLVQLNVVALMEGTALAVRRLREQADGGVVVNVASSSALQPLAGMAAYAASKAFVLNYSEAVAVECAGSTVRIITICPGGTDTGFQAAAGVKRAAEEKLVPAADAAAVIFAAIVRGVSSTVYIGLRVHAMGLLARVLPRRSNAALWGRLMNSMR